MTQKIQLEESWRQELAEEFEKDYMKNLRVFLAKELENKKTIYPHGKDIFSAFNSTPFSKVKVVIIGQDPYHGPNQAHGLCFSVKPNIKVPPSLKNIYKEMSSDLNLSAPDHGCLQSWAEQGVLLLNAVLTVEKGKPASHHNKGWEQFTDKVIEVLNKKKKNLVFLLWGSPAQKKGAIVDPSKHLVLKTTHPSPFSAHRGFLGSQHFSKTNQYLEAHNIEPINWSLPSREKIESCFS